MTIKGPMPKWSLLPIDSAASRDLLELLSLLLNFFLLVASNTFLGVGTQGDMFTQIYLISHPLSCSCSLFFLWSGSAILNRKYVS